MLCGGPRPAARSLVTRRRKALANVAVRADYTREAWVTGPVQEAPEGEYAVDFRRVGSRGRHVVLVGLVLLNISVSVAFLSWVLQPAHVPSRATADVVWIAVVAQIGFCLVLLVELVRIGQSLSVCVLGLNAKDPVPVRPEPGLRVAFLTTIVPSKEPLSIVAATLARMKEVTHDGTLDVWILDEGDDPAVKVAAAQLGVRHFSRKGRPEYNTETGAYRAKTKCGNHNAWRAEHEHEYDVVAQLDPDHVPFDFFFERTLGYFRDPDVGFVVAPQVYGNPHESFVSYGASGQQFLFSGLIERGGNGLGAPLLIGTNHLYRPTCWDQIGGYQDSIIEDHLTSIHVQAATNPATGRRWKGVYTPDILAIGEGPTSWADYFNQQGRWAYGIWQIMLDRTKWPTGRLGFRRRLTYALVQSYYPSVALAWVMGYLATAAYLVLGATSIVARPATWFTLWGASLAVWAVVWLWLRRYNLVEHERRRLGVRPMLLTLLTGPVYLVAAISAVLRRPLAYRVTAKGSLASRESLSTFKTHLIVAALSTGLILTGLTLGNTRLAILSWALLPLTVGLVPPLLSRLGRPAERESTLSEEDLEALVATESLLVDRMVDSPATATTSSVPPAPEPASARPLVPVGAGRS